MTITAHMAINVETIRYWMERRGLNQTQLAAAVGVSQPAIAQTLNRPNGGARITFAVGLALAHALQIEPEALLAPPPANEHPAAVIAAGCDMEA